MFLTILEHIVYVVLSCYLIYQIIELFKLWRQGKLEKVAQSVVAMVGDDDADTPVGPGDFEVM